MAHVADHLSFTCTFLLPCCAFFPDGGAVRDLSTPNAKAHLVYNCGSCFYDSCCIMALSQKLTQRLHEYIESSANKMYAHADRKEFGEV